MKVVLQNVVLRFADIWEPKAFEEGQSKRYSATFLVEPGSENDTKIRAALSAVAKEAWKEEGDKKIKMWANDKMKFCYRDGNQYDYDGCADKMLLATTRQEADGRPKIVNRAKEALEQSGGKPYPGCTVNAVVDIYAQTKKFPGIRCSLGTIQYIKDGAAFSKRGDDGLSDLPDLAEDLTEDDLISA